MRTIVISDLHLGLDDRVSEMVLNRPKLVDFLDKVRGERMADELVIAGDFLDQWFYPAGFDLPRDSHEFYLRCARNNQAVIDSLARLISAGIPVVYVPGNHDMTLSQTTLAQILPGIRQVRDMPGLGRYRTGVRAEVVVEHGHRYEIMCAPNPVSNAKLMEYGAPMLPPGYFFSRLWATSVAEGAFTSSEARAALKKALPRPPAPDPSDKQALAAYEYWRFCSDLVCNWFPVKEGLDEPFLEVAVDGLAGAFALSDLVPALQEDGSLDARLFGGLTRDWEEVQRRNLVPAPVSAVHAIVHAMDEEEPIEKLPARAYFDVDPTVDVVVLGHTHLAAYKEFPGYDRPKRYANCGTWVDSKRNDPMNDTTFVLVESMADRDVVQTLRCVGDHKVDDILAVESDHIRRA